MTQRILIVSLGNVPHNESQKVEGGGLRCWGLAKSLAARGFEVRLCVPDVYLSEVIIVDAGLEVFPYATAQELINQIDRATAVIYPAGAPHISNLCIDNRGPSTILIADAYVPIHVEVASRQFEDKMDK